MKRSFRLAESAVAIRQPSGLGHPLPPAVQACYPFALGRSGQASAPVTRQSRPGAFTLIELLVVVAVIAILAGITMAALGGVQKRSARSRAQAEVAALAAAIDNYHLDNGVYPPTDAGGLYGALSPVGSGKVYFEPRPTMIRTNGEIRFYIDPWGADYQYSTNSGIRNVGSYDLWTTAGSTNTSDDIRN